MHRIMILPVVLTLGALATLSTRANGDVIVAGYAESSILLYAEDGTPMDPIVPPGGMNGVIGPAGITFGPDGFLYVSNQTSVFVPGAPDSVVKVDPSSGEVTPFITLASGYVPAGLSFGADGNLYVCQNGGQGAKQGTGSVDLYDGISGNFISSVVANLSQPTSLLFDSDGNLYVSNFGEGDIIKFDGTTSSILVPYSSGGLVSPAGLRFGTDGNLYVVDLLIGAVHSYDPMTGEPLGDFIVAGGDLDNQFPSDLLFDSDGNLLVADLGNNFMKPTGNVKAFDASGSFTGDFATGIFGASQLLRLPK